MIIVINGIKMNLVDSDEVNISQHECGRCDSVHSEIIVYRDGKVFAHFGEYLRLHNKPEIKGNVIP